MRLARRQRIVGKAVAEIGQREVEPLRELARAVERLGQVGEELRHLARRLEVPLALRARAAVPRASSVVWWRMQVRTSYSSLSFARGVAHAVGGDERQPQAPRQIDERAVAVLLVAPEVALQLDVKPPGKDRGERARGLAPASSASPRERARERPLRRRPSGSGAPRRAPRPAPSVTRVSPFALPARAGGDEAAEVLVAGAVFDEESETAEAALRVRA